MPALADPPTKGGKRWADLRTRTLSAVVLAPIVLACIWFGGIWWQALSVGVGAGLMSEWAGMCGLDRRAPATFVSVATPIVAIPLLLAGEPVLAAIALLAGGAIAWLVSRMPHVAAGALYIGVPLLCLVALRGANDAGRNMVLFLVAIVWASDIGAYLAGRMLGGPKLAPAISPGKTWSGAAGGLVAAMIAGVAVATAFGATAPIQVALAAALLGIASQSGDLLESWIKRHFGVKDSGALIPGHGGLLDRLDGLLASALAATLLINTGIVSRGGVLWT